ncbi:hypothetical protein EGW08_005311 [Elysia chlorotica]|uniref:Iodothyronine deiodinase n=1 Tax=Elysia chlorotica TaxID=188477 RepID=A0A3S0ZUD2_ELYCH|nr:hypothetical protein EGW08_005311 [Elysia chlorotica]
MVRASHQKTPQGGSDSRKMAGDDHGVLPPGHLAKVYFLVTTCVVFLMHFVGRVSCLRRLIQPWINYPLHRFAIYKWNQLLFIAKCWSISEARKVKVGSQFEDIPLFTLEGEARSLSSYLQGKPLVAEYSLLANRYAGKVTFLTIYIREAHPMDGEWPDDESHKTQMHRTLPERIDLAQLLQESGLAGHLAVDSMQDLACLHYGAVPERICLVAPGGTVRYMSGLGPWGYQLSGLEGALWGICGER